MVLKRDDFPCDLVSIPGKKFRCVGWVFGFVYFFTKNTECFRENFVRQGRLEWVWRCYSDSRLVRLIRVLYDNPYCTLALVTETRSSGSVPGAAVGQLFGWNGARGISWQHPMALCCGLGHAAGMWQWSMVHCNKLVVIPLCHRVSQQQLSMWHTVWPPPPWKKKNHQSRTKHSAPLRNRWFRSCLGTVGLGQPKLGLPCPVKDLNHSSLVHHKLSGALCCFLLKYPEPALQVPGTEDYISPEIFLL